MHVYFRLFGMFVLVLVLEQVIFASRNTSASSRMEKVVIECPLCEASYEGLVGWCVVGLFWFHSCW